MSPAPPYEPTTTPLPRADAGCAHVGGADVQGVGGPAPRAGRPAPRATALRSLLAPRARPPTRWLALSVGLHVAVGAGTWWFVGPTPAGPERRPTRLAATIVAPSEAQADPAPPDPTEPILEALPEPPPLPVREPVVAGFELPTAEPETASEPVREAQHPWLPGLEHASRPAPRPTPEAIAPPPPPTVPTRPAVDTRSQAQATPRVRASPHPLEGNAPPVYPLEAARRGQHGRVLLRLWVAASGAVERVEVLESSGWPLLDAEALRALRAWRFAPRPPGPPTSAGRFDPQPFVQAVRFAAAGET